MMEPMDQRSAQYRVEALLGSIVALWMLVFAVGSLPPEVVETPASVEAPEVSSSWNAPDVEVVDVLGNEPSGEESSSGGPAALPDWGAGSLAERQNRRVSKPQAQASARDILAVAPKNSPPSI